MALLPVTTPVDNNPAASTRIGEASFFLESVLSDMDRSLSMATRRALTSSTNYIITNGEPLVDPGKNITSALVNGSISGQELEGMENVSLKAWNRKVSNISEGAGYSLEVALTGYSINASGYTVESSYSVFARMKDPVTLASFNSTNDARAEVDVTDLEDPMILLRSKGRYVSKYSRCGFDKPAEKLYTASVASEGSVHGNATVNPADLSSVPGKSEKILVADDIDSYSVSSVNSFAGAVSAQSNSSSGYTTEYAFDTGSVADIEQNMSLILNQGQVWRSGFRQMFEEGCYVETSTGPDVLDRMSNKLVSEEDEDGLATFIDVSLLPVELRKEGSAVGYVYFNGSSSYGGLNRIKGVSSEHSWFRVDDHHVSYWDLGDLAY